MEDVYSALVALCGVSAACLLILTTILGAYFLLKSYSLYIVLFNKDKNKKE